MNFRRDNDHTADAQASGWLGEEMGWPLGWCAGAKESMGSSFMDGEEHPQPLLIPAFLGCLTIVTCTIRFTEHEKIPMWYKVKLDFMG